MAEKGLDENDLIFDPTEYTLEEFLTEWKYRVEVATASGFKYSNIALGLKLIKSLDFSNRRAAKILEHVSVLQCTKEENFLEMIETTVRQLEANEWNWKILHKKQRWKIDTDEKIKMKNVLEDCCDASFERLLNFIGFEDKKKLCLISKRMYLRMNQLEVSIRNWNIRLTTINYSYYVEKLKSQPYKDAKKDIYLDFTEYTGCSRSIQDVVNLLDDSTIRGISVKDVDIVNSLLEARKTFENVDSISLENVKDRLSLIAFLDCSEMSPKKLKLVDCKVDKKVVNLGFETFSSLEDLTVVKNCMKFQSFRELLRKGSKTLKSLEVKQPSIYPFDIKVLTGLKFSVLQNISIDLEGLLFDFCCTFHTLEACAVSLKQLRLLKITEIKEDEEEDVNRYPLAHFLELEVFEFEFNTISTDSVTLVGIPHFPFSFQSLTELDVKGVILSAAQLGNCLDACSQTLKLLGLSLVHISGTLVLKQTLSRLTILVAATMFATNNQQNILTLLSKCGNALKKLGIQVLPGDGSWRSDVVLNLPKLKELSWVGEQNYFFNSILKSTSSTLTFLELSMMDIHHMEVSENIRTLKLAHCSGNGVSALVRSCAKNLELLTLDSVTNVDFSDGNHVGQQFPKLKTMNMITCKNISNLSSLMGKRSLSLEMLFFHLCDIDLTNTEQPNLKHLLITGSISQYGDPSSLLLSCSSSLETLKLESCFLVKKYKFENLKRLSVLHTCDKTKCSLKKAEKRYFAYCLKNCKATLDVLEIQGCSYGFQNLPFKFMKLRYLVLSYQLPPCQRLLFKSIVPPDCRTESESVIDKFFLHAVEILEDNARTDMQSSSSS